MNEDAVNEVFVLESDSAEALEKIILQYKPQKSILSSVINHSPAVEKILAKHTRFHKLSAASKLPFTTPVNKPETIGADRLALSAAAVHYYPAQHNLVIGLGSCITYNFL